MRHLTNICTPLDRAGPPGLFQHDVDECSVYNDMFPFYLGIDKVILHKLIHLLNAFVHFLFLLTNAHDEDFRQPSLESQHVKARNREMLSLAYVW